MLIMISSAVESEIQTNLASIGPMLTLSLFVRLVSIGHGTS